jgi:transposase
MTNGRVEVITSVERRRRWSAAEKRRLVAATLEPGASVSAIAREAGVHPSQLWGWRRQMRRTAPVHFTPVRVAEETPSIAAHVGTGTIEIELCGARLRITGAADVAADVPPLRSWILEVKQADGCFLGSNCSH